MEPRRLGDLGIFHRVVAQGSFTAAARSLGVTQSAVSQTVKRLEEELGIRLLARSTRSLAPTPAGERLLQTLSPAISELAAEIEALERLREQPGGRLRITCGKHAADTLVWPAFKRLIAAHPEIEGELSIENRYVDVVAERFDIGVRLRDDLQMDMVARRVGPDLRAVVVGAEDYLARNGMPHLPRDLLAHRCVGYRNAGGTLSPWTFERDGQAETVKISPALIVNDGDALVEAACAGLGLAYMLQDLASAHLKDGRLVEVLRDWSTSFPGYYAYYSSRRQPARAFTLFLEYLQQETGFRSG